MSYLGTTTTVYSWVFPETEEMLHGLSASRVQKVMRDREREAWTKKQDAYHVSFGETWLTWVQEAFALPEGMWAGLQGDEGPWHFYPSSGSSEAIRESLAQLAHLSAYRPHLGLPTIHVFMGEYEGYEAMAQPMGIRVVKHDRQKWKESLQPYLTGQLPAEGHVFYLSQPSSLDGRYWRSFGEFLRALENSPLKLRLDLCYVGCVPRLKTRDVGSESRSIIGFDCVDMVFLSLSKSFGVYYHRIGGVFSREPMPGLWGNRWFKNLRSLYLGELFMKRYHVFEIPDLYLELKDEVLEDLNAQNAENRWMGTIQGSDVLLLAMHWSDRSDVPWPEHRRHRISRFCLTPLLYEKAREKGLYGLP
jgi:hypothetical protein